MVMCTVDFVGRRGACACALAVATPGTRLRRGISRAETGGIARHVRALFVSDGTRDGQLFRLRQSEVWVRAMRAALFATVGLAVAAVERFFKVITTTSGRVVPQR